MVAHGLEAGVLDARWALPDTVAVVVVIQCRRYLPGDRPTFLFFEGVPIESRRGLYAWVCLRGNNHAGAIKDPWQHISSHTGASRIRLWCEGVISHSRVNTQL